MSTEKIEKDSKERYWADQRDSILQIVRMGLKLTLIFFSIAAVADWIVFPDYRYELLVAKIFMLSAITVSYFMTFTKWIKKHLEILFLISFLIILGVILYHATLVIEPIIVVLLVIFSAIFAATLIPWKLYHHNILVTISFLTIIGCALFFEKKALMLLRPINLSGFIFLIISIILARHTHKRRYQLWEAENALRNYAEKLDVKNQALEKAMAELRTLRGILPICCKCKQIRDDKGYWNQIEQYISKHSEAKFSHSICPGCADEMYGEEDWYKKDKLKIT